VVETLEDEAALEIMDRMSVRNTGKPFPFRSGIAFLAEPERVHSTELPFEHTPA
jgi:hypothetical protein